MAPPMGAWVMGTTTVRSGSALRVTVTVVPSASPSRAVYWSRENITVTIGSSLSVMATVASVVPLAVIPSGRVLPNPSTTDSPSSSTGSSTAVTVKLLEVSVAPNARPPDGTPE